MLLYHGSNFDLDYLEPQLDPRTGILGIWLTDIKEHAIIYSLLKSSSKANVEWFSEKNEFNRAEVTTAKENVKSIGYLYTFYLDIKKLKKIKEHSFISLDHKLIIEKKDIIAIDDFKKIGIKIKYI